MFRVSISGLHKASNKTRTTPVKRSEDCDLLILFQYNSTEAEKWQEYKWQQGKRSWNRLLLSVSTCDIKCHLHQVILSYNFIHTFRNWPTISILMVLKGEFCVKHSMAVWDKTGWSNGFKYVTVFPYCAPWYVCFAVQQGANSGKAKEPAAAWQQSEFLEKQIYLDTEDHPQLWEEKRAWVPSKKVSYNLNFSPCVKLQLCTLMYFYV